MKKQLPLLVILALLATPIFAQNEPILPRNLDFSEFSLLGQAKLPGFGITSPPSSPVRSMAEWEELQGLCIAWTGYPDILGQIVKAAKEETRVFILCSTANTVASAKTKLTSLGVDFTTNVDFIIGEYNSIWMRDYGPNPVYTNDVDSLLIIDWIYNRPRPKDDKSPELIATHINAPIYTTTEAPLDFVHTGGNHMSDGLGTAFSSQLVLDENDGTGFGTTVQTESDIDTILTKFMGINRWPKMNTLPYDVIHHIDMHMKLLDEETILVSEYPAGTADGPQIEANIQFILSGYKTAYGNDFKVIRIIAPPDAQNEFPNVSNGDYRTYTNSVFVNKTVILPTYEQKYDTTAIGIYEEALPGYKIVGIPCNDIIKSLGAIHCITKEVGTADPLLINHEKLASCQEISATGYPVTARMKHRSGISQATVYYSTNSGTDWNSNAMTASANDNYETVLPSQTDGTEVLYYFEAVANSGKKQVRPMPAPAGFYRFEVCEMSATHEISQTQLLDIFPNPANAITCLPVYSSGKIIGSIRVFDLFGRLVQTVFEGPIPTGESKYFIDAGRLNPGSYSVELNDGQRVSARKLIVR